ncbi:type III restriction-modification system StyLTI enzyme mod [Limosilactobacillus reuteri I5007]|uniref:Type III restriction-modification system StyLTI enzyme mod n=1 Tax=Limosilactobacillus reuteri I5007 TaxID=1340495 RepID=R9WF49_LIMRT|nr:site-specific DNA-methyltransferase [Limosilactobacillus reuteri]AGN98749.1 type III restriction-modification system StyLTI enzyme mod [Limosilactobacillus reuteri I5007]UCN17974.1 site-specific DNA-methyltransferase [Limosilactobacillus reuteri]UCN19741.1 site-specific DNA-methyltransferase [Limosilactobacillus reuteri]
MLRDNDRYNEQVKPNSAFLNELKEKLPEFFTKDGSFDMDKFKTQLKDKNINELSEGYQLDFIGKDYARRQAGEMPGTVIVPDKEQNHGEGKESKNLFFTGDNLEVLRHLQNNYQNKIDVIYIDPPYNTGSDGFVYPDSFEYSDDKLKEMFGISDDQVERLKSIQGKSSHSAWLTFMYPRLVLAKKLLSEKGIFFISIDNNEQSNLREVLIEIFGETNILTTIPVINNLKGNQDQFGFAGAHEYALCATKNIQKARFNGLPLKSDELADWKKDNIGWFKRGANLKATGINAPREKRPNLYFPIFIGNDKKVSLSPFDGGKELFPITDGKEMSWRWSKEKFQSNLNDVIVSKINDSFSIYKKQRPNGNGMPSKKPKSFLYQPSYSTGNGTNEIINLFGNKLFNYPKSTSLVRDLITIASDGNSTILDFFAGSSTTADAVMQLNTQDGGHRKFIMVQLPEKTYHTNKDGKEIPTKGGKTAYEAGFKSIDEISRERIRRASKKIREDNDLTLPKDFDGSFKHYRVVKPVKQTLEDIEAFDPNNTNLFTNMVDGFSSKSLDIKGDTSGEETILTTWLAKDGYSFDTDVEKVKFGNYVAHKVEDNRLYLINEGWGVNQTKELLNQLGTHQLEVQSVIIFGYSFNVAELRELENGLKQLDSKVTLIKRY